MTPIKPKALKPGATLGVVSPGEWFEESRLKAGIRTLEAMGFKVKTSADMAKNYRLAGADKARAAAINTMFADPEVDGILCARGGTGSFRLLPHLDLEVIRQHPKVFCGYSDVTLLLHHFYKQTGLMTFHGPMLTTFQTENSFAANHFMAVLGGETPTLALEGSHVQVGGTVEGELIGGNLCLLTTLLGTPDDFDTQGKVLFIEDVDEAPYTLDRMLWHLKRAGKLDGIKGLIVGEMLDIQENRPDNPYGHPLEEVLAELVPAGVPVVTNAPCGHGPKLATFPLGAEVRLIADVRGGSNLTLLSPAVS